MWLSRPWREASTVRGLGGTPLWSPDGFLETEGYLPGHVPRLRLIRSGDVESNPGPAGLGPCSICGETLGRRSGPFRCAGGCGRRSHRRQACSGLTGEEQRSGAWICHECVHPGAPGPMAAAPVSPGVVDNACRGCIANGRRCCADAAGGGDGVGVGDGGRNPGEAGGQPGSQPVSPPGSPELFWTPSPPPPPDPISVARGGLSSPFGCGLVGEQVRGGDETGSGGRVGGRKRGVWPVPSWPLP